MTEAWLALAGWPAAAAAFASTLLARRALANRALAVAEACHEVRGPLAAVTLGLELAVRQDSLPPARLRAIELELQRAAVALDDLEAVRHRRHARGACATVDVGELITDSVEALRPAAARAGLELRLSAPVTGVAVAGSRVRLAQAIGNLIANAIEHGRGDVEVIARRGAGAIRVEVRDRGPGLPAPVSELIRRARPGRRHGHGLRIAQAIAASHGGRLGSAPAAVCARLVLELPVASRHGSQRALPL